MRLLLVADTYPPARISGALQMRDLAHALAAQGHRPLVLTPLAAAGATAGLQAEEGVQVLRVPAPRTKDVPYWRRSLAELALPWVLLRGLRRSVLREERWDGVVWYSPTIFLGPLVRAIKRRHGCPGYLIVRDLFPDWAADAGVLRRGGLPYRAFKTVERYQYRQADVIGVQTPSNAPLVARDAPPAARIDVLHNWLARPAAADAVSPPLPGALQGRINFVYAGNMGVAQDMDAFVALARRLQARADIGFLFVGRGSETARLKRAAETLPNLRVLDEIAPEALSALLAQCHVGIIALDPRHGTHNIPGKLLTYLHAGLPVLARANPHNDLHALIAEAGVGASIAGDAPDELLAAASFLASDPAVRAAMGRAGQALAERLFSPRAAAVQVAAGLERASGHRP